MTTTLGIAPVSKKPIEAQAADALRDAIVEGRIAPGSRITETQLANEMGLSRATVRTALHQLLKEGLTVLIPYTGWTIIDLSADDVWELYTLRSSMERLAASLLAASGDKTRLSAFGKAFDTLKRACAAGDAAKIAEADFGLHKALIAQCGHGRLAEQYENIERQIRLCIRSSDALVESPKAILDQHRPLAEAVLAGRTDEAAALAEAHNLTEGAKLREHFRGSLAAAGGDAEPVLRESRGATRLRNQKRRGAGGESAGDAG